MPGMSILAHRIGSSHSKSGHSNKPLTKEEIEFIKQKELKEEENSKKRYNTTFGLKIVEKEGNVKKEDINSLENNNIKEISKLYNDFYPNFSTKAYKINPKFVINPYKPGNGIKTIIVFFRKNLNKRHSFLGIFQILKIIIKIYKSLKSKQNSEESKIQFNDIEYGLKLIFTYITATGKIYYIYCNLILWFYIKKIKKFNKEFINTITEKKLIINCPWTTIIKEKIELEKYFILFDGKACCKSNDDLKKIESIYLNLREKYILKDDDMEYFNEYMKFAYENKYNPIRYIMSLTDYKGFNVDKPFHIEGLNSRLV